MINRTKSLKRDKKGSVHSAATSTSSLSSLDISSSSLTSSKPAESEYHDSILRFSNLMNDHHFFNAAYEGKTEIVNNFINSKKLSRIVQEK